MNKDQFFEKYSDEQDLASASISSMSAEYQARFRINEKLLAVAKLQLLESAVDESQQKLITTLDEIFTWHCTMLSNAMFLYGAELMEKELAVIWSRMR